MATITKLRIRLAAVWQKKRERKEQPNLTT
ncbi:hypothetical protein NC652_006308 [Populus alba x Populus x berolinensis]|nr:hypothetical protein NC652_006308 [Populus alba x Populus x berolinensis]